MPNPPPEIVVALSTLLGVLFTGLISLGIAFLHARSEERRHLREIAINAAIRYWEHDTELAKLRANANPERPESVAPLDSYIIHTFLLADLVSKGKITRENIVSELSRIRAVSDAAAESAKPQRKEDS